MIKDDGGRTGADGGGAALLPTTELSAASVENGRRTIASKISVAPAWFYVSSECPHPVDARS